MNVGVVGLGRLGFPIALAIGARGHDVCGWDISETVRADVEARYFPHPEGDVEDLLKQSTVKLAPIEQLVEASEIVFVAVQTPHEPDLEGATPLPEYRRDFDYSWLQAAVQSVANQAAAQRKQLTLAVISTVLPGTMQRVVEPLLPEGVTLAYNPLFTAMGRTVRDFLSPEFVLIGSDASGEGESAKSALARLYGTLHDRPLFTTDVRTAELIKVAYNTFIGQKIVFANAMMEISHKVDANVDDVTAALSLATDRIVSPRYLEGGMGDGGACHPRDNIALSWLAREVGLSHDIFDDVMQAREGQTAWLADLIAERANGLPVTILGKAFKPGSNLVAGSPALLLANLLEQRGVRFTQHDHHVDGNGAGPPASPGLYFIATRHPEYEHTGFPAGSVVLDPWGYIPDQEGVEVVRIGRP